MSEAKNVILVIDDNPDFLKSLVTLLEASNYAVVQAPTAKEGLEVYRSANPDLIIVDLMMEDIDAGKNFAEKLKKEGNEKPVYLLSSAGDEMNQSIDCNELGFSGIIQKPYDAKELLNLIKDKLTV